MSKRTVTFAQYEHYHCFNRGVDKRKIFLDAKDFYYFQTALQLFNQTSARGDMTHYKQAKRTNVSEVEDEPLVSILAYCLNPNHFHLLLHQETNDGISKFMQKLSTGYTMYFNKKYERTGSLLQGKFKAVHVENEVQLQHLFAYVTSNNLVHGITNLKEFRSSFAEITDQPSQKICNLKLIDDLFDGDIKTIVSKGIKHTISYRKSLEHSNKSEFLE